MPVKIAIAEDNSFALRACRNKVATESSFKVVNCAFNGVELLAQLLQQTADVILMDILMPAMDGIECTRQVKRLYPQIKVIMLTTFDDDQHILEAIMAGASGYLLKEEGAEWVVKAIKEVLEGGAPMSAGIASKVLNLLRNPLGGLPVVVQDFGLTQREIELLEQLKSGLSYEEIAVNLFISHGTVRKHINNIYTKLQVNNKVSALAKATEHRLI